MTDGLARDLFGGPVAYGLAITPYEHDRDLEDEDDYPQDAAEYEPSDLELRTAAVDRVREAVADYLTFGTMKDLLEIING